jgi:Endonuclease NucS
MITERNFEDVLVKYPELIEVGLRLIDRQSFIGKRRFDLLFKDHLGRRLLIELKWGPIIDKHIGQIMSYEGLLHSNDHPDLRVMLIGTRVPPNLQRALDHHGIAWKEITRPTILALIQEKQDIEFIDLFTDHSVIEQMPVKIRKTQTAAGLVQTTAPSNPQVRVSYPDPDVRIVVGNQFNLNNTYIKVAVFIDWFEPDTIGGNNKQAEAARKMMVEWEGQPGMETDIDGRHKSLRKRSLVSRFMKDSGLVAGDKIEIRRLSPYRYRLTRLPI